MSAVRQDRVRRADRVRPEMETPAWLPDAGCRDVDPRLFFPEPGHSWEPGLAVCAACPVREDCLEYAIEYRLEDGLWGGLLPTPRRDIRRARDRAAKETQ